MVGLASLPSTQLPNSISKLGLTIKLILRIFQYLSHLKLNLQRTYTNEKLNKPLIVFLYLVKMTYEANNFLRRQLPPVCN